MNDTSTPSAAAVAVAEREAFKLIVEIADLMHGHADELADAAISGDRARVRVHACLLAGAVRSALLTVNDIFTEVRKEPDMSRVADIVTLDAARAERLRFKRVWPDEYTDGARCAFHQTLSRRAGARRLPQGLPRLAARSAQRVVRRLQPRTYRTAARSQGAGDELDSTAP